MGIIYLEGQFKKATQPVKMTGNFYGGVDPSILEDYVTKEDLQLELEEKIDEHTVSDEVLIIE